MYALRLSIVLLFVGTFFLQASAQTSRRVLEGKDCGGDGCTTVHDFDKLHGGVKDDKDDMDDDKKKPLHYPSCGDHDCDDDDDDDDDDGCCCKGHGCADDCDDDDHDCCCKGCVCDDDDDHKDDRYDGRKLLGRYPSCHGKHCDNDDGKDDDDDGKDDGKDDDDKDDGKDDDDDDGKDDGKHLSHYPHHGKKHKYDNYD